MFDDAVLAAGAEYVWQRGLGKARALVRLLLSGGVEAFALSELDSLAAMRVTAPGAVFRLFVLLAYLRSRTVMRDEALDALIRGLKTRLVPVEAVEGERE